MSTETCILTTKDFTILEVMRERCLGSDDPLAPILKRKIESALVVFRDDVPANVATLSSRVTFRVDGREPDTRILSHDRMNSSAGLFLPISRPRALALIGLAEGQDFILTDHDGREERVVLETVAVPAGSGAAREGSPEQPVRSRAAQAVADVGSRRLLRPAAPRAHRIGRFRRPGTLGCLKPERGARRMTGPLGANAGVQKTA